MLVLEGLLPFLRPKVAQQVYFQMSQSNDRVLRNVGLTSMVAGVVLLFLVR